MRCKISNFWNYNSEPDPYVKKMNDKIWEEILDTTTKCPKCGLRNCQWSSVGDECDERLTCPDCNFTKCYDGIDS